ncbi:EF-hand domain-containing protein [Streptomyces sp. NPDC033753]|uniref:EF-hand domain-containing protein n=1 Tax=Streptomyces sp. NPDC033753 TaxID=3155128 RepID=UPI0033EF9772
MDNDFYARKMNTRFDSFDRDRDGVITEADFEQMAAHVLTGFGFTRESPQGRQVIDGAQRYWSNLAEAADANRDSQLTPQEFRAAASQTMLGTPAGFQQTAQPWYEAIAQAADNDGDGRLSADEYRRMMRALGATEEAVKETGAHLTDGDGSISVDAVIASMENFYTSDKPHHPATYSFGKF